MSRRSFLEMSTFSVVALSMRTSVRTQSETPLNANCCTANRRFATLPIGRLAYTARERG
jgi:hypothetical protein